MARENTNLSIIQQITEKRLPFDIARNFSAHKKWAYSIKNDLDKINQIN